MASDTVYKIHLVKSFKSASNDTGATETPPLDRRYDPFHHRVTPIETFASRVAALVHQLDQTAEIGTERSDLSAPRISKTLTLRVNEQAFTVSDPWPAPLSTPASAHDENCRFLESAHFGVTAFAKAVAAEWPSLEDGISSELGKLEKRLRSNCHDILRRANRQGIAVRARAARNGLSSVPSEPTQ